ncbi:MAG: alpha/beta hydrolase, partial [Nitrososphaeraceae archaeon]
MTHSKSYDNNKNNVQSKTNPVVDLNEILSVENASAERILSRIDQTPIQEVTVIKRVQKVRQNVKFLGLLCLSVTLLLGFSSPTYSGFASPENKTLMQPQGVQGMATNATNIVLVHGIWADGSSWNKVIPILKNAGHKIIAVQLPLHSLADDVATVKRAINLVGGPTILVGHSYGGFVITNAGYNNQNVTGLVYVSAFGPDEGESTGNFVDVSKLPPGL